MYTIQWTLLSVSENWRFLFYFLQLYITLKSNGKHSDRQVDLLTVSAKRLDAQASVTNQNGLQVGKVILEAKAERNLKHLSSLNMEVSLYTGPIARSCTRTRWSCGREILQILTHKITKYRR